jgi:hypothetical protein
MNCPSKNNWVVPTLTEIAIVLSSSGMHEGAVAVIEAAAVVSRSNGVIAFFGPPAPLTSAPMIEGNVILFSVVSRNRR